MAGTLSDARRRRAAAAAKAGRAAVILPGLLAVLTVVVKDAQAAGFSVFGTFALLVMTNYDQRRTQRILQVFAVTFSGAVMIAWGTIASSSLAVAVLSACVVAYATQAARCHGVIAATRTVGLLAFMVAVTAPAPAATIVPRLGGWTLSGIVALLCLLTTWMSFGTVDPVSSMPRGAPAPTSAAADDSESGRDPGRRGLSCRLRAVLGTRAEGGADATRAAVAAGSAVLMGRVLDVEHGFWIVLGVLSVLRASDTGGGRTFLEEQGGTLVGFLVSVGLVLVLGSHRELYWMALPITVFVAAYVSAAVGFGAGQAAFTLFIVVLLNVIAVSGFRAGIMRVENIAIGGAMSLVLGAVWPVHRGLGRVSSQANTGGGPTHLPAKST